MDIVDVLYMCLFMVSSNLELESEIVWGSEQSPGSTAAYDIYQTANTQTDRDVQTSDIRVFILGFVTSMKNAGVTRVGSRVKLIPNRFHTSASGTRLIGGLRKRARGPPQ